MGIELTLLAEAGRPLVSAARATGHPLLTADERIADSGLVAVIWD